MSYTRRYAIDRLQIRYLAAGDRRLYEQLCRFDHKAGMVISDQYNFNGYAGTLLTTFWDSQRHKHYKINRKAESNLKRSASVLSLEAIYVPWHNYKPSPTRQQWYQALDLHGYIPPNIPLQQALPRHCSYMPHRIPRGNGLCGNHAL